MTSNPTSTSALRVPGYRAHMATYFVAMLADNTEHVISYWMMYQKFESSALAGFAVIAHWLPPLVLGVYAGALADRFDPRRLIQIGMLLFMAASIGWGYFFVTDTLQMWHAMALLVIHGLAGVFWQTPSQLLVHDIVNRDQLPSAVRMNATARTLGLLVGPALGAGLMLTAGPIAGIFINALLYLPVILWLWKAPYGPRFRAAAAGIAGVASAVAATPTRAVRGFSDVWRTLRDVAQHPLLSSMLILSATASFCIGNSYQAQMPHFAMDLGHGDPGVSYSALLAADAAGALFAGLLLERFNLLKPHPRTAIWLAMGWCFTLGSFALMPYYPVALVLLFAAGMCELSFNSINQALVQLNAPSDMRGRIIGLFNMASLGLRTFSGFTVGLLGSAIGVHWSLSLAAVLAFTVLMVLQHRVGRAATLTSPH
ncbi:MFS transporter [Curvibacter sp. CHRR-16]|uniref:MFS transporter n=1 Tax=Curvibacter sp. CHRR-16 TaxID=2835872 RepID=UPI001BDAC679|nr:MFS transporter [Curvibacter sp. CHRR-16]MBT0569576.1 MFS transporter [Curvibacter sp. CHRR-16]